MIRRLGKAVQFAKRLLQVQRQFDELKLNQGRMLSGLNRTSLSSSLRDHEFKVFSQWGEDGIIQFLTSVVPIQHRTFIEFGVEDFTEANCRFLLMKDNWRGFVIDGSEKNVQSVQNSYFYWQYDLRAVCAFITRENINELLDRSGFDEDLGLLSVDIDGVDYWVLEAIARYRPRILIVEYNSVFGSERAISVPYCPTFRRTERHYSNLYFGASLSAFSRLAGARGYALVGTNSTGSNAFFVRSDVLPMQVRSLSVSEAFTYSNVRESRDEQGRLSLLAGKARMEAIKGCPVIDVATGQEEPF
jgi:hypothetical protein